MNNICFLVQVDIDQALVHPNGDSVYEHSLITGRTVGFEFITSVLSGYVFGLYGE